MAQIGRKEKAVLEDIKWVKVKRDEVCGHSIEIDNFVGDSTTLVLSSQLKGKGVSPPPSEAHFVVQVELVCLELRSLHNI